MIIPHFITLTNYDTLTKIVVSLSQIEAVYAIDPDEFEEPDYRDLEDGEDTYTVIEMCGDSQYFVTESVEEIAGLVGSMGVTHARK